MNERWPTDKIPGAEPRPFRFEDLNGKPEPIAWGPVYPDLGATVAKFRRINRGRDLTDTEIRAYGVAIDTAIRALNKPAGHRPLSLKYHMPDYAAKCRAEMAAAAARDNLAWRTSEGIKGAYAAAMIAKRAREAREAAAETIAEIVTDNAEAMTRALAASRDVQAPHVIVQFAKFNPYDQALEFRQRIDGGETVAMIATSLALPTPALIRNRLQLLNLIPEAVDDVRDGRLSANAAYGVSLAPKASQRAICDAIRSKKLHDVEAIKRAGREARKAA